MTPLHKDLHELHRILSEYVNFYKQSSIEAVDQPRWSVPAASYECAARMEKALKLIEEIGMENDLEMIEEINAIRNRP